MQYARTCFRTRCSALNVPVLVRDLPQSDFHGKIVTLAYDQALSPIFLTLSVDDTEEYFEKYEGVTAIKIWYCLANFLNPLVRRIFRKVER